MIFDLIPDPKYTTIELVISLQLFLKFMLYASLIKIDLVHNFNELIGYFFFP